MKFLSTVNNVASCGVSIPLGDTKCITNGEEFHKKGINYTLPIKVLWIKSFNGTYVSNNLTSTNLGLLK